jgi:hypothetical protein
MFVCEHDEIIGCVNAGVPSIYANLILF